jgi:hypothetical protein
MDRRATIVDSASQPQANIQWITLIWISRRFDGGTIYFSIDIPTRYGWSGKEAPQPLVPGKGAAAVPPKYPATIVPGNRLRVLRPGFRGWPRRRQPL